MTHALTRLNPPSLPDLSMVSHSQITVMEPGRLAFVSGQVAWRAGAAVPAGLAEQAEVVAGNLRAALDALGASPHDVALMRVYAVDLTPERLEAGMPPLLAFLDGARPSLTGIGVAALAAPDLQIEVEMVVRLPG